MGLIKLWGDVFIPSVKREEWGAREEKLYRDWYAINLPFSFVRFSFEDLLTRYNTEEHIKAVQECQREHMDVEDYEDIKYSFLISREGVVFHCRGWFIEPVRPPKYADLKYKGLEVVFIGDYSVKDPPFAALKAANLLVTYGLKERYINASFTTISLRDHLK